MKTCFKLLAICLLCCVSVFAQDITAIMYVDGATNPSGISDVISYTSIFREMMANTKTTMSQKIAMMGFSDPADVSTFQTEMRNFEGQALGQTGPQQMTLASTYYTELQGSLTSQGLTEFQTYIANHKTHMALWSPSGNAPNWIICHPGIISTSYDGFPLDYGTPDSEWDYYGDSYVTNNCPCGINAVGSALTYLGVVTNGTTSGGNTWVSKDAPNGGTSPFAGTGVITTTTLTFRYNNACDGTNLSITWTIQDELAYTKFLNTGLNGNGACVTSGGGEVCTWNVRPICSNTAAPDYRYPGGPPPNAWIRDYYFAAWRSVGACIRVVFSNGHTPWLCQPVWPANLGTGDVSSGSCTYNP